MEAVFTKALFKLAINDIKVPMKLYKLILNLFHRSEKFAQHNIQKLLLADFCTENGPRKVGRLPGRASVQKSFLNQDRPVS